MKVVLCTNGMIPATFGAEGGGRPGKGQVMGKHSRRDMSRMAQGSVGGLPSMRSIASRVWVDSGETEKEAFPFVEAGGVELGRSPSAR